MINFLNGFRWESPDHPLLNFLVFYSSQQQFSELNFSRGGRKTREPGRKHHQILHPIVIRLWPVYCCQTPKKWFLARSLILDLLQASETLVSYLLKLWPRSQLLTGTWLGWGGVGDRGRSALTPSLAVYVVNKWEVNIQCLRGALETFLWNGPENWDEAIC